MNSNSDDEHDGGIDDGDDEHDGGNDEHDGCNDVNITEDSAHNKSIANNDDANVNSTGDSLYNKDIDNDDDVNADNVTMPTQVSDDQNTSEGNGMQHEKERLLILEKEMLDFKEFVTSKFEQLSSDFVETKLYTLLKKENIFLKKQIEKDSETIAALTRKIHYSCESQANNNISDEGTSVTPKAVYSNTHPLQRKNRTSEHVLSDAFDRWGHQPKEDFQEVKRRPFAKNCNDYGRGRNSFIALSNRFNGLDVEKLPLTETKDIDESVNIIHKPQRRERRPVICYNESYIQNQAPYFEK